MPDVTGMWAFTGNKQIRHSFCPGRLKKYPENRIPLKFTKTFDTTFLYLFFLKPKAEYFYIKVR